MCHNHYIIVIKSAAKVLLFENVVPAWLMNFPIAAIAFFIAQILSNARLISPNKSTICSVPIDKRMVEGVMCWASNSSGESWE